MFRRKTQPLADILNKFMREEGFETQLLQRRLLLAWEEVTGKLTNEYTKNKFIQNQTLWVQITNSELRHNLLMMKRQIIKRLNDNVGSMIITDIRFY